MCEKLSLLINNNLFFTNGLLSLVDVLHKF